MPDSMLLVQILKAIAELALMFFLARGLLVLFFLPAPQKLEGNLIYGLLLVVFIIFLPQGILGSIMGAFRRPAVKAAA